MGSVVSEPFATVSQL